MNTTLIICITTFLCTLTYSVLLGVVAFKILSLVVIAVDKFDKVDITKHIIVKGKEDEPI